MLGKLSKLSWRVIITTLFVLIPLEVTLILLYADFHPIVEDPQYKMNPRWISTYIVGDIGNELFDLAAALGIGRYHGLRVIVTRKMKVYNAFTLPNATVYGALSDAPGSFKVIRERMHYDCKYDSAVSVQLAPPFPQNAILWGYFQSWKYFRDVEGELRNMLTFKLPVLTSAKEFLKERLSWLPFDPGTYTLIGIHVRRGDMLRNAIFVNYGYPEVPVEYFENAVQYFRNTYRGKPLIVVICSDDLSWAKVNLEHLNTYTIFSEQNTAAVDLAILSLCDHVIISMGTFGWWGAWLSNGTATYYKNWPRNGSALDKAVSKEDYFPPKWIGLE